MNSSFVKKIQERVFPFIIATSALSVSASAAFYSVSGLSKLFAGATLAVIIMATSLEVAKLVIASLLYQYRKTIPRLLKYYLTVAAVVLVLITSMGIYGFLSAAYQETANKAGNLDAQIALVETKRDNVKEQLAVYNEEKSSINEAVTELRNGLSNNKIQYRDKETGQIITTTSSSTRRALEKQLDQAVARQTEINTKVDALNEQLFNYETEIVKIKTGNDLAGELGPLKYLSGLTGIPMDKIINYLLLTIIFVFDPLAISLVIAANFAFEKLRPKTRDNIYGEKVLILEEDPDPNDLPDINDGMWTEEEMEDFNEEDEIEEFCTEPEEDPIENPTPSQVEIVFKEWEEGNDWNKINDLKEIEFTPENKKILEDQYQLFKLEKQREEVSRSTKDSRWKSRNLKEINEKINSLKQKESGDDLTITY